MAALEGTAHFVVAAGLATTALATLLEGAQGLRISRLSLPFLVGTAFSDDRRRAMAIGFAFYLVGGFLFAGLYWLVFAVTGLAGWWEGALLGLFHGLFLLVAVMPVLPFIHPRMAAEHDGPKGVRGIEPPGFLGLNYGYATPVSTLVAQAIYGAILGGLFPGT
jgi:hypothetical protein